MPVCKDCGSVLVGIVATPKTGLCPSCADKRIFILEKDYKVHQINYMAVVERVLGRKASIHNMHPTDVAVVLENEIVVLRKLLEKCRELMKLSFNTDELLLCKEVIEKLEEAK